MQSLAKESSQVVALENDKANPNVSYQNRLLSIDILRGIALLLMVLDHTRDFFGSLLYSESDLSLVIPSVFFSRWITHLCAPTFVLLAGVSAYLYGLKHTKKELSQYLITRGLWLILLELTIITFAWKFTLDATLIVQVIYALGLSMIVLSGLIWLPRSLLIFLSLAIIIGQQWLTALMPVQPEAQNIFKFFYGVGSFDAGTWNITVFYSLFPWAAVMCLGYCLGPWFKLPSKEQTKRFLIAALISLTAFLTIRYFNLFGNPTPWSLQSSGTIYTLISFINVNKYPASLQFLLLTFSIVFFLLPLMNRWDNAISRFFLTFGKVSLFFYIIHLYLIHLMAYAYSYLILKAHPEWWWGTSPWIKNHYPTPSAYEFQLSRVYLVSFLVILIAYPLCLAYKNYKSKHKYAWLSYI